VQRQLHGGGTRRRAEGVDPFEDRIGATRQSTTSDATSADVDGNSTRRVAVVPTLVPPEDVTDGEARAAVEGPQVAAFVEIGREPDLVEDLLTPLPVVQSSDHLCVQPPAGAGRGQQHVGGVGGEHAPVPLITAVGPAAAISSSTSAHSMT